MVFPFKVNRKVFRNRKFKLPCIKFFFFTGEAKPTPPLGPVIAMFQLNMNQVCKDLNELSSVFVPGLPISAKIFKTSAKVYSIVLGFPTFKFLLENELAFQLSEEVLSSFSKGAEEELNFQFPSSLPVEKLYDLVRVHSYFLKKNVFSVAPSVFSSLRSMKSHYFKSVSF